MRRYAGLWAVMPPKERHVVACMFRFSEMVTTLGDPKCSEFHYDFKYAVQITSQRLLNHNHASRICGKNATPPPLGLIRIPYPKVLIVGFAPCKIIILSIQHIPE